MTYISSFEEVEQIYNEFAGIQPSFSLEKMETIWKLLNKRCEDPNLKNKSFTATDLDNILQNSKTVTRGILRFFVNLNLLDDVNKSSNIFETDITAKGRFWFHLIGDNSQKIAIFLNQELRNLKTVKLIFRYLHNKMPSGVSLDIIENDLGDEMVAFWKLYPDYPKDNKTGMPARKPFNKAVIKDLMQLLMDLLLVEFHDEKYFGPIL